MNKIIAIAMISLFATAAQAKTVAAIQSVSVNINTIRLSDSGVLSVEKNDGSRAKLQLTRANAVNLNSQIEVLSQAEIETVHNKIVCMMMFNPSTLQNLLVVDAQTGKLRMTLSNQSCAIGTKTYPKEEYVLHIAQELKSSLLVLANQLINE